MWISRGVAALTLFVCGLFVSASAAAVTITGISPPSATAGTIVTITGTGFSTTKTDDTITFVGHSLTARSATATALTVTIPVDWFPSTANVKVTVTGQTAVISTMPLSVLANISSITPTTVNVGDNLTINGTNLIGSVGSIAVNFTGGVSAMSSTFHTSSTQLQVAVPAGAQSGPIWINNNSGTATSSQSLFVNGSTPTITGFSVSQGMAGTAVTINGTNFSPTAAQDIVKFNGVTATVSSATTTAINTTVPAGATTGPVTVTVGTQTATSPSSFTVVATPLSVTSFSPPSGVVGNSVTITGTGFSTNAAADAVAFNGTPAIVTSATPTTIVAVVPPYATSGPISVTVSGQTQSSATSFSITCPTGDLVSTFLPNVGARGVATDSSGNIYALSTVNGSIEKIAPDKTVSTFATGFDAAFGIAVDLSGNVYVADTFGTNSVYKISAAGVATLVSSNFSEPYGIVVDPSGNIFVGDWSTKLVKKITPAGVVSTFAGSGALGGADGTGTAASFLGPEGLVLDSYGNLYVADTGVSGVGNTVRKITPAGVVTTIAGSAATAGSVDGAGASARFGHLGNITIDKTGMLYVVDQDNFTIRSVTTTGIVTTVAGLAGSSGSADGMGTSARFTQPFGITADSANNLYVGDSSLRKLVPSANCPSPTCSGVTVATPNLPWNATTQRVTANGVQNAQSMTFPTWYIPGGQNDIQWLSGTHQSGADTWYVDIDLTQFDGVNNRKYGSFETDVYMYNPNYNGGAPVGCGGTSWTIATPPPPNTPSSISVPSSGTSGSVSVSFSPDTSGGPIQYYVIERGTSSTSLSPLSTSQSVTASPYLDSIPGPGTYWYGVAACNTWGCSAYKVSSNGVTVTGPPPVTLPPMPAAANDTPPANDPTVGTAPGQAGVDGGASTYTIPIVVPPGRDGMQPSISLNYNSRSGNGALGVGWSIGGSSSIHRCPQTSEQDGKTLGVSYTANDRLCLDGQRLVSTSGTYGAAGTQYRTEIDSYARITQAGGDLTGALACFVVEQRDGRILHYGAVLTGIDGTPTCLNSPTRVQPAGAPATLAWLLAKVEDRVGNNQIYGYTDYGSGELLLSQVSYTGFGSAAGNRTVTLAYQSRSSISGVSDISSSYLGGGLTMQTKVLQSVTTKVGTSVARVYLPSYVASAYSGRVLLSGITECAGASCSPTQVSCPAISSGSACHPPTVFTYNDDALNTPANFPLVALTDAQFPFGESSQGAGDQLPVSIQTIGDLDGDGARETAAKTLTWDGSGNTIEHDYLIQATADRVIHTAVDLTGTGFVPDPTFYADIDGDGRADMRKGTPSSDGHLVFSVWKLARGASIPAGATYSTLFTDYPSNILFCGGDTFYTGDFNGDGKLDVVRVTQGTTTGCATGGNWNVYVYLNAMTGVFGSTGNTTATFTVPSSAAFTMTVSSGTTTVFQTIDHISDFNGDGLPDFYIKTTTTQFAGQSTTQFAGIEVTQAGGVSATLQACGPTTLGLVNDPTAGSATDVCTWSQPNISSKFVTFMDVNGDGLEDIVLARPGQATWRIILNQGGSTAHPKGFYGAEINTGSSAGLDLGTNGFRYAGRLPTLDLDSDGRPDILVPTSDQGVNNFALKMCTAFRFTTMNGECPERSGSIVSGTNSIQVTEECVQYTCPEDPGGVLNMGTNSIGTAPLFGAYTGASSSPVPDSAGIDNSVYHLSMLKFVQTGASSFTVTSQHTPLIGRLRSVGALDGDSMDMFGDGLADLSTVVGCTAHGVLSTGGVNQCLTIADGTYGPNAPLPDGTPVCPSGSPCPFDTSPELFLNINQGSAAPAARGVAGGPGDNPLPMTVQTSGTPLEPGPNIPDLLFRSLNGVGDLAVWVYAPLSFPANQAGLPLYTIDGNYLDSKHYYFQSSMPIVTGLAQSDGAGDYYGFRTAVYAYTDAVYNHMGRGFMGFGKITSETGNDSVNHRFIRTQTTFNQRFPLIGKVAEVVTSVPNSSGSSNVMVRDEIDSYACTLSNRAACPADTSIAPAPSTGGTVFTPVLDNQLVKNYDLSNHTQYAQISTVNVSGTASGWDAFGNLTAQTITRSDVGSNLFVASHATTTTNQFDTSDVTHWWINKLTQSTTSASISYGSTHALPTGTSAPNQSLTTNYTWATNRSPSTKSTQTGTVNQRSVMTYCYAQNTTTSSPSCPATTQVTDYGLPTSTSVCMGSYNVSGVCGGDLANFSPLRTTNFTYTNDGTNASDDGYFVLNTKNALSQTTKTTRQTSDGQVLTATDPNGVQVVSGYDAFGRAVQVQHLGSTGTAIEPVIQTAYALCLDGSQFPPASGHCGSSLLGEEPTSTQSLEANAAYRTTTTQAGYPTKVVWYDRLGREVKTAERGYTGTFTATVTNYDALGTVSEKYAPYYVGSSATYATAWIYDALNRPSAKTVDASDMDSTHGDFITVYAYAGGTTNITAHGLNVACPGTSSLCMTMSRSQNVLGQYMQTVDANGKQTNYWTEPLGHVAAIKDAEGNITSAGYNALGLRTSSNDPDQGTWSFTYDALGELSTQTDARGIVTSVVSRDSLGRATERQQVPPVSVPLGTANETVDDTFTFDPAHGIGEPGSATRKRGTNRTTPSSNPTTWTESYAYETTTARLSTTTTNVTEASSGNLTTTENYDTYGRPSTVGYPSGVSVQTQYGKYGHSGALGDGSTGQLWWEISTMDAWNGITAELFVDGTTGTRARYASSGQDSTASWKLGTPTVDSLTYHYDSFGNLVNQTRAADGTSNTETYLYDKLQRLTNATRSTGGAVVSYGYTDSGNLSSKSDFASGYTYASANTRSSSGCGPHAANTVTLVPSGSGTYTCDVDGNVYASTVRSLQVTYNADNQPRTASAGGNTMAWGYDAYGRMSYEISLLRGNRVFGPQGYEQSGTKQIHELGPIVVTRQSSSNTITTSLRDRLGSTIDTIDSGLPSFGNTRTYDVFGAARNGDMTGRTGGTLNLGDTIHGFTKHDQADDVQLIHMGGRIYDYNLGRFLSVDPIIGNPLHSQSLNPYSYIGNNPLSGKDPSGYVCTPMTGTHNCGYDTGASNGVTTVDGNVSSTKDGVTTNTPVSVGINGRGQIVSINRNGADAFTIVGAASAPNNHSPDTIGAQNQTAGERQIPSTPLAGPPTDILDSAVQRLSNLAHFGKFNTYEQQNDYIAAMATAYLQGGNDSLQSFIAKDSPVSGTKAVLTMFAGGVPAAATEIGTVTVTATAQDIISANAQRIANGGFDVWKNYLSRAEIKAFERTPSIRSMLAGQAVHRGAFQALESEFPKRFEYFTKGADFLDKSTGELIELTTSEQVGAHMARPGYGEMTYSTYKFPGQ